ncbi:MAG: phosphoribosyltransferase family protein, partial [Nitrososphaerota archaeon]
EFGAIDSSQIIHNPTILKHIVMAEYEKMNSMKIDKVLTLEADGIPVAYQIASMLGREVAVARKVKKLGVRDFIEIKQVFESGTYRYIYLPKGSIKKGDYVLITDDIVRTGATIKALMNLCKEVKANVSGVFTIIALKKINEKLEEELGVPVISFTTL